MRQTETNMEIVADIGGTNARFACVTINDTRLLAFNSMLCADHPHLLDAIRLYMSTLDSTVKIRRICLAVAGPIETDLIDLPNSHWAFSRSELQKILDIEVVVINDFTAQLLSVPTLSEHELIWLGPARVQQKLVIAALGPGTGLGVAGMTVGGEIIPSEGGHLAFAPVDEHEVDLLRWLWRHYPRVSVERILSGPGLLALYQANTVLSGQTTPQITSAAQLTQLAHKGSEVALQSIQDFAAILGSVAGEVAIAMGARGGVYLAGGVLSHIEGLYPQELLRSRFNAKGRFTEYCAAIPLALLRAEHTGLRGCVYALRHNYQ